MKREDLIKELDEWIDSGSRDMDLINGSFPLLTKFHYQAGVADPDTLVCLIKNNIKSHLLIESE